MTLSHAHEKRQDSMATQALSLQQAMGAATHSTVAASTIGWMADASCAAVGGDWWFPDMGQPSTKAQRICGACPVRDECLNYAITNRIPYGIWGGLTTPARERLWKSRGA